MSKFESQTSAPQAPAGPVLTDPARPTITHEGGAATELDLKGALFTLAAVNMVGEDTFYEKAEARDERFRSLVFQVTLADPGWVARFVPYLRGEMNMRSAPIIVACEYAAAIRDWPPHGFASDPDEVPSARSVIASACLRADEPAELLAYWWSRHGRVLPKAVKRGIADAAVRLYTERSALRYDGQSRGVRMADVIELTHPKPSSREQAALFRWLIDRRHKRTEAAPGALETIVRNENFQAIPVADRRTLLEATGPAGFARVLGDSCVSWEALSGWMQGPMDKLAWEAAIPSMGLMALTRNLRNFDEAGVSDEVAAQIGARLTNAEEVRRSRQFPFRFWTAYREAPSKRWAYPLEQAARHACANLPRLRGRTLVAVDVSASMNAPLSGRSTVSRWEAGAVFAGAAARACDGVDLVPFATHSARIPLSSAADIITAVEGVYGIARSGRLEYGTNIWTTIRNHYDGHERVVIFTDDQAHDSQASVPNVASIPSIYTFDLGGYGRSGTDLRQPGRYRLAGFSDASFRLMDLMERGRRADWPF